VSPRPLLLGIDEGTTGVRVVAVDTDLNPVAEATRRKATIHPEAGRVEQDPEAVLDAVVDAVAEVLGGLDGEVVACGIDHQGASVLAWDGETGAPRSNVIVWQDTRSQPLLQGLRPPVFEEVKRQSGLPVDPTYSAGKIAWLVEQGLPAGTRIGTVDAFLTDRLGGVFATDPSTASRTQLARAQFGAADWDPRLLEIFGVDRALLPPVADSAGELGTLRHERWPQDLPLRARVVDQQAALAGAGCVTPGRVKATYGTGVSVLAHAGTESPWGGGVLVPTVAWRIDGRTEYALDGGVLSAGALLEWLCVELGVAEGPAALAELAGHVEDAGGVRILPALAGVGSPWWRTDATAMIAGLRAGTTRAHVARAALEAIAWRVADVVETIAERVPIDELRTGGRLTGHPLMLQLQADACGVPVERGPADATAAGAAALAAVGAGVWPSTESIADRVAAAERTLPQRPAAWREAEHAAWRAFVQAAAVFEP
jgi:glycerol kinase